MYRVHRWDTLGPATDNTTTAQVRLASNSSDCLALGGCTAESRNTMFAGTMGKFPSGSKLMGCILARCCVLPVAPTTPLPAACTLKPTTALPSWWHVCGNLCIYVRMFQLIAFVGAAGCTGGPFTGGLRTGRSCVGIFADLL